MFVDDIRTDFYNSILGKRIAVFVSFDIDALCACKILQYLLQCDHILYSLIPVTGIEDLEKAFHDHSEQVKHFVFVNCGANLNLLDLLNPDEDTVFFVADSHRPIDIFNVYNSGQVRILMKPDEDDEFPPLEKVYRDEDDSDEENDEEEDDEDSERASKRRRFDESAVERRIERKRWEQERDKILFEYNQFSFHGPSTAILFFELAWKMSKDNNDLLWWASIGLTDSFVNHKIEQSNYVLQAGSLQGHVSRLNHRNDEENSTAVNSMKLSFDKELQLVLYRHWSLYQSLKHTTYTACQFRLWTMKGKKKLYEFLAELGLPLSQCRQQFSSMDMFLKNNVKSWIEGKVEKYGLDQIVNGSFFAQFGFKHKYCAADLVYATSALLETGDGGRSSKDNFLDALSCLSRSNLDVLEKGIEQAKKQASATFQQVQTFLDLNQVISAGPFLYAVISESAPGSNYFSHPICLMNLAHSLLQAHVVMSKNRKSRNLPLVLVSPCNRDDGTCLAVGIPPLSEDSPKNFFGQAFLQAGSSAKARTIHENFDSCIIKIVADDSSSFFDSLTSILK